MTNSSDPTVPFGPPAVDPAVPGPAVPGPADPGPAPATVVLGPAAPDPAARGLIGIAATGAVVAIALGAFGSLHSPTGVAVNIAGFSSAQSVKAWLATVVVVLAVTQIVSAAVMYGKLTAFGRPAWIGLAHRWCGRLAFLASVPVAMHCLYALGFQTGEPRVLVHSLLGCAFYGVFTSKMLTLTRSGMPGWLLPACGTAVFVGLALLWVTSSLWFFTTLGVQL